MQVGMVLGTRVRRVPDGVVLGDPPALERRLADEGLGRR